MFPLVAKGRHQKILSLTFRRNQTHHVTTLLQRSNYNSKVLFLQKKTRSQITTTLMLSYLHADPPFSMISFEPTTPGLCPVRSTLPSPPQLFCFGDATSWWWLVNPKLFFVDFDPRNLVPIRPTKHVAMNIKRRSRTLCLFARARKTQKTQVGAFSKRQLFILPSRTSIPLAWPQAPYQGLCQIHFLWCVILPNPPATLNSSHTRTQPQIWKTRCIEISTSSKDTTVGTIQDASGNNKRTCALCL